METEGDRVHLRGRHHSAQSIFLGPKRIIAIKGRLLRIGESFDEFWMKANEWPPPSEIVEGLRKDPNRPDLFTSAQKLPNISPQHPFYYEWDEIAAVPIVSYDRWFSEQADRKIRKNLRKSLREGIVTKVIPFSDDLVRGIASIYNELPVRQGKKFRHFGKDAKTVERENRTYLERSVFIGAFLNNELVGFAKIVFDDEVASLMQFLSKAAHHDKRPNDALMAKSIEVCEQKGVRYLTYGQYTYGKRETNGLTQFKKSLGFQEIKIPRYFIPLTLKGRAALGLHLHKGLKGLMPPGLSTTLARLRANLYRFLGD